VFSIWVLIVLVLMAIQNSTAFAQDADPHLNYQYHCNNPYIDACVSAPVWVDTIEEGAQQQCDAQYPIGRDGYTYNLNCKFDGIPDPPGWSAVTLTVSAYHCDAGYSSGGLDSCDQSHVSTFSANIWLWTRPIQHFASVFTQLNREVESTQICPKSIGQSRVADPINPANGGMSKTEGDCATSSALIFGRSYDSTDSASADIGGGWHHSFARSIKPVYQRPIYKPYVVGDPDASSLYNDELSACVSGFAQIQSRVANWVGAVASYENGLCVLRKGGVYIGTLTLQSSVKQKPVATPVLVGYDAARDDGHVIRFYNFTNISGDFRAPPSTGMRFQTLTAGFAVSDEADNVETYDLNGILQTITSRSGVIQTMVYDTSGRLSAVTDSFGHQLTLGYDTQNRVISVTRQ